MRQRKLPRAFYDRGADKLAPDLIGKILVHRTGGREYRARITEAEAYVGTHDLACHASKGRTKRTEIMFGPPGFAYVYLIYGMYDMFNIVASDKGDAQAVLIRAATPLADFRADLGGPGKLCRAMRISRALNGIDLTGDILFLMDDHAARPALRVTPRIGIEYAGEWTHAPLRFVADPRAWSSLPESAPSHTVSRQRKERV